MKGFTLIEALVAIAIITIAVSAPLYTASRSALTAANSENQLVASYLAQEGIEYVRMMRDNEYLAVHTDTTASQEAWSNFTTGSDSSSITQCIGKNCQLEVAPSAASQGLTQCAGNNCSTNYLYLLPSGSYTQDGTLADSQGVQSPTTFVRTITASLVVPASDILITSTVTWSFRSTAYSVTVTDHLTPWQ